MATDTDLLRSYARDRSESAFTELVQRHINLVHSAALREAHGDASMAEDVTQAVFAELARKASSLFRHPALAGWLYTCVRQMAANVRRAEDRRQRREQEAQTMNELLTSDPSESVWRQVQPVLDDAMHELGEADRTAVVLRFFDERSLKEVGLALGLTENAARMRVDRALEKLQRLLSNRGVKSTAAGLTAAITAGAVVSAPTSLAASVATGALAATAATASTTFTVLKLMTMTKLKVGVISAVAIASVATPLVIQHQAQVKLRDQNQALRQRADQLTELQEENQRLSNLVAQANGSLALSKDQLSELMRLRGEAAMFRKQTNEFQKLREENRRLQESLVKAETNSMPYEVDPAFAQHRQKSRIAKDFALALVLYAFDNQDQLPTSFDQAARYLPEALKADPVLDDTAEFIEMTKQFEIVYKGPREALTKPGDVILIRERQAWQTPDSKWAKAYAFADGSAQVHVEPDGNFDAWEKQHMISSAPAGE